MFVRSFDTLWFPDSHSWTKLHMILRFGTMIDHIKTLLRSFCQLSSPIFDLVITYFLSLSPSQPERQKWDYCFCQYHLFVRLCVRYFFRSFVRLTHSGFRTLIPEPNHIGSCCFSHNDISYQDLAWDCSSTSFTYISLGYNLFPVIGIGIRTFIPEPNHIGSCLLVQW